MAVGFFSSGLDKYGQAGLAPYAVPWRAQDVAIARKKEQEAAAAAGGTEGKDKPCKYMGPWHGSSKILLFFHKLCLYHLK